MHSHTIEGPKFDNHGPGVWHCFSTVAASMKEQGETPAIGGRYVARFLVEKGTVSLRSMGFHCVCRFGKLALATLGPESLVTYKGRRGLYRCSSGSSPVLPFSQTISAKLSPCALFRPPPLMMTRVWRTGHSALLGPLTQSLNGCGSDECLPSLGRYLLPCTRHYILYYIVCSGRYWKYGR